MLAGEAGIGKTRLAAELAAHAHADGAVVLYGRFDEEAPAPYQPVVEMLRGWAGGASLAPLAERLGPRAAELGIVLPEFGAPAGGPSARCAASEADAQRLRFFDAIAALLAEIAGAAPLLVVLDDLHWADLPTLQLIGHLVRAPAPERALFLATARAEEGSEGLAALLAALRREGVARADRPRRPRRRGDRRAGRPRSAAGRRRRRSSPSCTARRTAIRSSSRRSCTTSPTRTAASAARSRCTRRRARRACARSRGAGSRGSASPRAQMLATAAVIGREFDFDVLEEVGPLAGDELVAALEEAVEARVLREDAERVGRYAFVHALMRATLYDGLSAVRRARLHGRVGEALIARRGAQLDPHLGPARPSLRARRAGRAARARGRLRARRRPARGPAAGLGGGGRALPGGAARARAGRRGRRPAALRAAARARRVAGAGRRGGARGRRSPPPPTTARALGDPALLGRAALGYAGRWSQLGRVEEDVAALLQEALGVLGGEDSPLRARLLARLALELYYAGDPDRRLALSEEAVALARRLGDPLTLATCLDARHYALWRPETVQERLEVASELRRIAEEVGDPELELEGAGWTVVDLLELGDVAGADIQIAAASRLAAALHRPLYEWWTSVFRCARAQLAGDFDEAERLAQETLAIGQRGQAENAVHVFAQSMYNIRREQGRLAEVEEAVHGFIAMYPAVPAWRCSLALLHLELGREDEARAEFDALAQAGFGTLPRDAQWLIAMTLLAEVCGRLGDAARAGELYALLAPYAGRNVVVGRAATCNGSASRLLGVLAAVQRRVGARGAPLRRRAGDARGDGRAPVHGAHPARLGGDGARARRRAARPRAAGRRDRRGGRARDGRGGRARAGAGGGAGVAATAGIEGRVRRGGGAGTRRRVAGRFAYSPPPHPSLPQCAAAVRRGGERVRPGAYRHATAMARARRPSSPAPPAATRRRSGTAAARAAASGTRWSRRPARPRPRGAAARRRVAPSARSGSPTSQAVKVARLSTGIGELDRVLGGGLVPGSLVLLGGSPGIGKSTLTSMALGNLAGAGRRTLYVSGEESAAQIKLRAERLPGAALEVPVLAETDLDTVLATLDAERPEVCVIDSVQTLHAADLTGAAGSVGQVREVADRITRLAKARDIAVLLVGHVTKEGALAGPRVLEHLVDCVLQFEGERERTYRTLRALKNRFGSTSEAGVFEMRQGGLVEVQDASARFVGEATRAPGQRRAGGDGGLAAAARRGPGARLAVRAGAAAAHRERHRPQPARAGARGAGAARRASASAAPTCSSTSPAASASTSPAPTSPSRWRSRAPRAASWPGAGERPIACFGEIGLTGELRSVAHPERRLAEAAKFGLAPTIAPAGAGRRATEAPTLRAALKSALAARAGGRAGAGGLTARSTFKSL